MLSFVSTPNNNGTSVLRLMQAVETLTRPSGSAIAADVVAGAVCGVGDLA